MVLKEHELLQIDEQFILRLLENDPAALAELSLHLTNDLKEALDSAIGQERSTSDAAKITDEEPLKDSPLQSEDSNKSRKPGRQPGSQGFGRTQQVAVTETIHHRCGGCTVCHQDLTAVEKAYTGFQTVNIEFGNAGQPGVHLNNIQHLYYTGHCPSCGLENRSEPWRAPADTSD